jgi:LysR family transcriptional regulator for metE and metH
MKRYRQSHPQVDIRIDVTATSEPIANLIEGRLDVAIVSDPVRDRRVVARPLFDDELVVVLHPHHPLATRPFLQAEDFAQETLLTYSPKEESTIYQRVLLPAGVMPAVQQVQITEAMIELVKAGLGVAVLARWAVDPYVKSGLLRAVRLTRLGYRRTWSAATLKDMARVPYVKAFIDLIAAHPPFTARARGLSSGGTSVSFARRMPDRRLARRA